jgi:two-component sensor histidine kinase
MLQATLLVNWKNASCRLFTVGPGHTQKGLGIKLVLARVTQISGELKIMQGNSNRGTNFTVIF